MSRWLCLSLVACSSGSTTAKTTPPPPPPPADAAIAVAADADVPQAVLDAPAWVFRYATAERTETWTLRHTGGQALLIVTSARGEQRYVGTGNDTAAALTLVVSTGSAKLALECKHVKRPVGTACNDKKAKPIDALDCYHPDFKEPMPFGPTPGIEYVVAPGCNGYRLIAP